jgi:hypothetical protein
MRFDSPHNIRLTGNASSQNARRIRKVLLVYGSIFCPVGIGQAIFQRTHIRCHGSFERHSCHLLSPFTHWGRRKMP